MKAHPDDDTILDHLQRAAFDYFLLRANPANGLIPDTSRPGSPASIAVVGFALSCYPIAVERGWIQREDAIRRTLATLRFFWHGPPGATFATIGHRGFCYHFLDIESGKRAWKCEVSFIDTALLLAGMLTAMSYFTRRTKDETEIRKLADQFYRRIEWDWALNGCETLAMAWQPGDGFNPSRWAGYNESLILYFLGLASPTHPLAPEDYTVWASSYEWRQVYDIGYLYGGPLFVHHFSHAWVDFRGIRDAFMEGKDCDYFENSRRAALIQQKYAVENKFGFTGYARNCWGLSAGDGPCDGTVRAGDTDHPALGYAARGVPDGPDDGTLMPSAVVSCLPFAPGITMKAIAFMDKTYPRVIQNYHIPSGFNPSVLNDKGEMWISDGYYGLDQGIMTMMIENHRTGMVWNLMRGNRYIKRGLRRAGFKGGWIDAKAT
jgi:hypothetical protein